MLEALVEELRLMAVAAVVVLVQLVNLPLQLVITAALVAQEQHQP
jgi:hypothetical protein